MLEEIIGNRSYGKKKSRYCRRLKGVYKLAVMADVGGNNSINDYYKYLIMEKGYPPYNDKHKSCRRLATFQ